MKKTLLAVLVVILAVSCFAMVTTAAAATEEVSIQDTLANRGYFKYGDDYFKKTDIKFDYEDGVKTGTPFALYPYWEGNFASIREINGSNAYDLTVLQWKVDERNREDRGRLDLSKLVIDDVMTYIQFDVYTNAKIIDIYSQNGETGTYWFQILYERDNDNKWSSPAGCEVKNLNATLIAENTWRVGFLVDFSKNSKDYQHVIVTEDTVEHTVAFDNFISATLDTVRAPWVSNSTVTYGIDEPHDVAVNLDAKGKAITSVKIGDDAVDAANYSYAGETLTIKAAAFTGKTGDLTCTAATESGSVEFGVKQEQTKTPLTASLVSSDPINKYVDGTTDVKQAIELSLAGVADGHDVKLAYTAAYDNAAAGTGRKIVITLSLTGNDAYLYKLTETTLEITGCEIYDYITVTPEYKGQPVVKYEDGTAAVAGGSVTLTLTGVEEGDEVSCTFNAVYDAATAGDRKINITNIVLTGKDAYKYNLSADTLEIDGQIVERTTVTPSYDGLIEKRFDGTTYLNTKGIQLALSDIADGDEVTATFRAFFTSANAGECQVEISDIVLTGKDAYKYKLSKDSFNVDAYIAEVKDVAISDNKGYYTMDGQTLQIIDFDSNPTGSLSASSVSGLYIAPDNGVTQNAEIVAFGDNHVMKLETNCHNWTTQLFATNTTSAYRSAGIYAVAFKIKPVGSLMIEAIVRNSDANDVTGILADFRLKITNDGEGKAVKLDKEFGGWTGNTQKYSNEVFELDADGWINCYFEFEVPEGTFFNNQFKPNVTFLGASPTAGELSTYYFDDIKYICKSTSNKYMTIDHDYDMEGTNGAAANDTPFYSDLGFVYDNEWTAEFVDGNTVIRLDVPANNADRVGLLKNGASDGALKLFKGKGLHYVQFDFDMDCASFNLFSLGLFDIKCEGTSGSYNFTVEVYAKSISNFKTEIAANGMTRVSFLIDMTDIPSEQEFNLKATTGSAGGSLFFDNLFVSREDYTPIAKDAKYNFVDMQDVVVDVDLKGARLLGVELDGTAVATDKFVYDAATGKLTLDKSLFATTNPNAAARTITIKTSAGDITATASIVDNRPDVTLGLEYTGEAISKGYDGTTDVEQSVIDAIVAQITMSGVTEGDDVTLTYDIAYSSKNAGAVTIVISNIALAGDDAVKYSLKTTSLSVDATINKIQLTVSGTTAANKEYDGTTTAAATAGTLGGVLTGENVTLSASAVFNSKNVSEANKVTVTYVLSGDDAANYLAPAPEDVTASITKKTVTVTADAKSIKVGDADPELTYKVSGLIEGDVLTGALSREQGTEAGEYNILQGTLSGGNNYQINFVSAKLTITKAADKPTEPVEPTEPEKLSAGAIAGIVVGSVAVAGGAAAAVVFIIKKRRLK